MEENILCESEPKEATGGIIYQTKDTLRQQTYKQGQFIKIKAQFTMKTYQS